MGTSESIIEEKEVICTSREIVLQELAVFPLYTPYQNLESINISFLLAPIVKLKHNVQSIHKPKKLVDFVINCYEEIQNIPELAEAIITGSTKDDDPLLDILNTNFQEYIKDSIFRESILNSFLSLKVQPLIEFYYEPLYTDKHKECGSIEIDFERLVLCFESALQCLGKSRRNSKIEELMENVSDYFDGIKLPSTLTPPPDNFCERSKAHQCVFEGSLPNKHGICSNGSYLFILTGKNINIFSLNENCSLSTPMKRIINKKIVNAISIDATDEELTIYDKTVKYVINICEMIKLDEGEEIPVQSTFEITNGFYLSDGVTHYFVDRKWQVKRIIKDGDTKKVKLEGSNLELNEDFPDLLPSNHFEYPTITNGQFIGIIYPISQGTYLMRVFSLSTGKHIYEETFNLSEEIVTLTLDLVNKCYFVVHPKNNEKLIVRRYHFFGSEDPYTFNVKSVDLGLGFTKRKFKRFARSLSLPLLNLMGSQVFPQMFIADDPSIFETFIDIAIQLLELPLKATKSVTAFFDSLMISISIIISMNLLIINNMNFYYQNVGNKVNKLVELLPVNAAVFICFNNIEFFFKNDRETQVALILKICKKITWEPLYPFIFRILENSDVLGTIPLSFNTELMNYIHIKAELISETSLKKIRFLITHQRIIIHSTLNQLKKDPLTEMDLGPDRDSNNPKPFDIFIDYLEHLVISFSFIISTKVTPNELQNSLIFILFDNFMRLLSILANFHAVARITTTFLLTILTDLSDYIKETIPNINDFPKISNFIITLLFAYGKFAATLVMGGGLTDFETKCMWIMRANINLVDNYEQLLNLDSDEIGDLKNKQLKEFISGEFSDPMNVIYKKHKAPFHKNLSDSLKQLDRIIISAICKHTGILEQLFSLNSETTRISTEMKKAADQMMKVRNEYRSLLQKKKFDAANDIRLRGLMLLRMESRFLPTDKKETLITEFIISNFSPEYVKTIIKQQRTRIQVTLLGFGLINRTYSMKIHPLLLSIIAYTLSSIESFEGLSVIMKITELSKSQIEQMKKFFNNIINIIETTHNNRFTLIAMRMFRDIEFNSEIEQEFLQKVIENSKNEAMFALGLLFAKRLDKIPKTLLGDKLSPSETVLLADMLKKIPGNDDIFNKYTKRVLNSKTPLNIRVEGKIILQLLNQDSISEDLLYIFFKAAINIIGANFVEHQNIGIASEIINILRITINEELRAKKELIKVIKECNTDENEYEIAGAFATLSNCYGPLYQYCNAKYHKDATSSTNVICIPTNKSNIFYLMRRPILLNEDIQLCIVKPPSFIYSVPLTQVNQKSFTEYNWILSFFNDVIKENRYSHLIKSLYIQVVDHFMKEAEFMKLITKEMVDCFALSPISFGDILDNVNLIKEYVKKPSLHKLYGFNVLNHQNSEMTTLISPKIKQSEVFSVTFSTKNDKMRGFVGIVALSLEGYSTQYSFIEIPDGIVYPSYDKLKKFKPSQECTINIDMTKNKFTVDENECDFPIGGDFRVIFAYNSSMTLEIKCKGDCFEKTSSLPFKEDISLDINTNRDIYENSTKVEDITGVPDIADLPKHSFTINKCTEKEMLQDCFAIPSNEVLIHPYFATSASKDICTEALNGLFNKITQQWMTIALIKVVNAKSEMITDEKVIIKLFTIISVLLEKFLPSEYRNGRFPFSLTEPIWDENAATNEMFMSLNVECKNALKTLSSKPEIINIMGNYIKNIASNPRVHFKLYHNKYRICMPPKSSSSLFSYFHIKSNYKGSLAIYTPPGINVQDNNEKVSITDSLITTFDNSWIFGTSFELLILIKNYIALCKNNEQAFIAKSSIIDSFIISSPFIYTLIPQFFEFLQGTVPSAPSDVNTQYRNKIVKLGIAIKKTSGLLRERMNTIYYQEQKILTSKMAAELSCHFPEFFNCSIPKPISDICKVPRVFIDPAAITEDFTKHILMISLFARNYRSIVGFPFWEIIPYWYRVSDLYKGEDDYIQPHMCRINNSVIMFSNPFKEKVIITFDFVLGKKPSSDATMSIADTELFDNPIVIKRNDMKKPIQTEKEELFFALTSCSNGWNSFKVSISQTSTQPKVTNTEKEIEINISEIHDRFIQEMEEFAVKWDDEDTDSLLNVLPRNILRAPTFSKIKAVIKDCTLATKFSPTVLYLRALLIHHFNYIKLTKKDKVHESIWSSIPKFVSCEDANEEFIHEIKSSGSMDYVTIKVDRHSAHRLIIDGEGDQSWCIIHQLSDAFSKISLQNLRCPERPWKASFEGENAIDMGGPTRELMTEAASSIFEPTSQLTFPVPNARHNIGNFKDVFVPYDPTEKHKEDYHTIGTLIGMVIRTGIVQDLPFAPFVFKFLSGSELNSNDIIMVDDTLLDKFNFLRNAESENDSKSCAIPWTVEQWDGQIVTLPDHSPEALVNIGEVETYINECISFRISSTRKSLIEIRSGFIENIGIESHPLLTSYRLSHMVQGSNLITVQQIRSMTVIKGFSGFDDPYIIRFFNAIERFNPDQMKMLLKFITTLTRLGNSSINKELTIKIDRLDRENPDETLPTASTCFNTLHLPCYSSEDICYKRLLVAITYCQTMENR